MKEFYLLKLISSLINFIYLLKSEKIHFLEVIFVMPNSVSLFNINILVNVQKNTFCSFFLTLWVMIKNNNKEKDEKIFKNCLSLSLSVLVISGNINYSNSYLTAWILCLVTQGESSIYLKVKLQVSLLLIQKSYIIFRYKIKNWVSD